MRPWAGLSFLHSAASSKQQPNGFRCVKHGGLDWPLAESPILVHKKKRASIRVSDVSQAGSREVKARDEGLYPCSHFGGGFPMWIMATSPHADAVAVQRVAQALANMNAYYNQQRYQQELLNTLNRPRTCSFFFNSMTCR